MAGLHERMSSLPWAKAVLLTTPLLSSNARMSVFTEPSKGSNRTRWLMGSSSRESTCRSSTTTTSASGRRGFGLSFPTTSRAWISSECNDAGGRTTSNVYPHTVVLSPVLCTLLCIPHVPTDLPPPTVVTVYPPCLLYPCISHISLKVYYQYVIHLMYLLYMV